MAIRLFFALVSQLFLTASIRAQCPREALYQLYQKEYEGSKTLNAQDWGWTGNTASCVPGVIAPGAYDKTLLRINFFRKLVGLPGNVTWDNALHTKCQEAALMMHATSQLNHFPDSAVFKCWTAPGKEAAGKSNLGLGFFGTSAIDGYIRDDGGNNSAVGHRRWILFSRAGKFGFGATTSANALWVIGNHVAAPANLDYVAYPAPGVFPLPLTYPRWSFSKPGADFSKTAVTVKDAAGKALVVTQAAVNNAYGDRTIVWTLPGDAYKTFVTDQDYTFQVRLDSVKVGAEFKVYEYEVNLVPMVWPPVCPAGSMWSQTQCQCAPLSTSTYGLQDAWSIAPNPVTDQLFINGPSGSKAAIAVFDATGRRCISKTLESGTILREELVPLQSGWYWVQMVPLPSGKTVQFKMVLQRD